jgi:hypothetical protein
MVSQSILQPLVELCEGEREKERERENYLKQSSETIICSFPATFLFHPKQHMTTTGVEK